MSEKVRVEYDGRTLELTVQQARVLKKAMSFEGVCPADFGAPDVCDGGTIIMRVGARLYDLDKLGVCFENLGWRKKTKVFRAAGHSLSTSQTVSHGVPSTHVDADETAPSLFSVPVGKPDRPHWMQDAGEAA